MSEQALIQQLIDGDEAAYRQVVVDYHRSMLQVARSIVGDAIADEVVQESWVSVLKSLANFEQRSSLKTWILRIVSNNAKTRLRKENRSIAFGDINDLDAFAFTDQRFKESGHWSAPPTRWHVDRPDEILSSEQVKESLLHAIDNLPPAQKAIVTLRDIENIPMEDICKILEVSESNGRVLLHRARTKLWQVIEQTEVEPTC